MKSDPEKKGKSPRGSKSRAPGSFPPPEQPSISEAETGGSPPKAEGAAGRSAAGGAKPARRNRGKQAPPPVRIVSDFPPERSGIARDAEMKGEPDGEGTEPAAGAKISREHIARRAYELYVAGGYEPGKEEEHWLEAERQLKAEQRRSG
jgi:hypothetical protein